MYPKDSYNVAVIGAGAIGLDHIGSFQQHPAARVCVVAETSVERGREAAEKFALPAHVTDYRVAIERPDIDVVSIALPNYLHAPVALEALRAGKHVMLDKPMATNAIEAAELVEEAKRQDVLLMVGQNMRFHQDVQTARQIVDEGLLGEVYHARTCWNRRAGIPRIGSWFTQKRFAGGGSAYDVGAHALDRALYLMGEFDAVSVSGQTYAKFGPRGAGAGSWGRGEIDPDATFDVDDLAVALIKLRSGRTVLLETAWAMHQEQRDENVTELFGTEAGLRCPELRLFRSGEQGYEVTQLEQRPTLANPNRMVHFIDVLQGKAEPFVKVEESLAVQRILDALYASSESGREVRLDELTTK